jgi:hypothetical protein
MQGDRWTAPHCRNETGARKRRGGNNSRVQGSEEDDLETTVVRLVRLAALARFAEAEDKTAAV